MLPQVIAHEVWTPSGPLFSGGCDDDPEVSRHLPPAGWWTPRHDGYTRRRRRGRAEAVVPEHDLQGPWISPTHREPKGH